MMVPMALRFISQAQPDTPFPAVVAVAAHFARCVALCDCDSTQQ